MYAGQRRRVGSATSNAPWRNVASGALHGEELAGMCAPDMLDEKGETILERAVLSEDPAPRLREHIASGSGIVSGQGVKRVEPAMFDQGETCQRVYSSLAQRPRGGAGIERT
jgi:hypothetical protein